MSKQINIGGRIHSTEVGNVAVGANEVLDDTKGKKQNVINSETDAELLRLDQSKQNNLTFDNAPTENSNNPVKSGGVYAADKALSDAIEAILLLIPSAASELNKLVDTAMMNSSISTATATFRGTYNVVTDLELAYDATQEQIAAKLGQVVLTADNNDYVYVLIPVSATSTDIRRVDRYKFNGTVWGYEYTLNNSGFTAAQWAAINSGITALLVSKLTNLPTAEVLATMLAAKQDTLTFDTAPAASSTNPVTSGGIYAAIQTVATALSNYETATDALIPSEATALNQLADKAYVLASILAATPACKGQFTTLADLQAVTSPKDGDLGIVRTKDNDGKDVFTFYQYLSNAWNVYYTLSYHPQTKPATTGTTGDYPYNGMGRVELPMNIKEIGGVTANYLEQSMMPTATGGNTIYVIKYDYTIGNSMFYDITFTNTQTVNVDGVSYMIEPISLYAGQAIFTDRYLYDSTSAKIVTSYFATEEKTIYAACPYSGYVNVAIKDFYKICSSVIIPDNCILEFDGGSINNGAIRFNNTQLRLHNNCFNDCLFGGKISGKSVNLRAFSPKCSSNYDDSWLVNSIIDICDENGVLIDFDFDNNLYISTTSEGEKAGWTHRNQIMVGRNTHIRQTSKGWIVLRSSTEAGGIVEQKYKSGNDRKNVNTVLEGLRIDGNNIHNEVYGENGIGVPGVIRDCVVKNCVTEEGENWQNGGGGKGISFESSDLDVFVENCAVYNCHTGFCYSSYANDNEINVFVNGLIVDGCKYGIRMKDQLSTSAITSFRSNVIKMNNILLRNCTSTEGIIVLSRIYGASITNCTIEGPEANRTNAYIRGSMMGCIFDITCGQKAESFVDFTDPSAQPYQPTDIAENMFRFRASQARSNNSVYWLVKYSDSEGLTKNTASSNHFDVSTNYAGLKLINDDTYISKIVNNSIDVLSRDDNGVYHFNGTIKDLYSKLAGNNFIYVLNKITDNKSGNVSQRPTFISGTNQGFMYMDSEINTGKITPIWWNGSAWVDATGTPV